MPRARPPRANDSLSFLVAGPGLADDAGWPVDLKRLRADIDRLVKRAHDSWAAGQTAGRRDEHLRNDLIAALATSFQAHSGWTEEASNDYRTYLGRFLARVLASNDFNVPGHQRLLRLVPKDLRVPRSKRQKS